MLPGGQVEEVDIVPGSHSWQNQQTDEEERSGNLLLQNLSCLREPVLQQEIQFMLPGGFIYLFRQRFVRYDFYSLLHAQILFTTGSNTILQAQTLHYFFIPYNTIAQQLQYKTKRAPLRHLKFSPIGAYIDMKQAVGPLLKRIVETQI